jgi:hypothetical protein
MGESYSFHGAFSAAVTSLPQSRDYERLRCELRVYVGMSSVYMVVAFTQVTWMVGVVMHVPIGDYQYFQTYFTVSAVVALPMFVVGLVHYMALVKLSLLHGLQPLPSTARVHHGRSTLWYVEVGSLAFVAVGIVMLVTDLACRARPDRLFWLQSG